MKAVSLRSLLSVLVLALISLVDRSHGSALGVKLRRFCDGQKFRYVFF